MCNRGIANCDIAEVVLPPLGARSPDHSESQLSKQKQSIYVTADARRGAAARLRGDSMRGVY